MQLYKLSLFILLLNLGFSFAYCPSFWAGSNIIGGYLLSGNLSGWKAMTAVFLSANHAQESIYDMLDNCHPEDGSIVSARNCTISVVDSVFGIGLAVCAYTMPNSE